MGGLDVEWDLIFFSAALHWLGWLCLVGAACSRCSCRIIRICDLMLSRRTVPYL